MSKRLALWNLLPTEQAAKEILPCCGSAVWADGLAARRPFPDEASLLAASDETWRNLAQEDWIEAFGSHPRIGGQGSSDSAKTSAQSLQWSQQEQELVAAGGEAAKAALAKANEEYERRFHRIFIVCATGKSGPEILEILRRRLGSDEDTDLHEAAEQQRMIIRIRLKKWFSE